MELSFYYIPKTLKVFEYINRIWKIYQNIRITPPILWNVEYHSTIFQRLKFPSPKWHTSIPVREPKFGLWNNLHYIERWNFQFCCIPKSQITPPGVTHIYVIQTGTYLSPELRKVIKGPWKKLRASKDFTKTLEQPLQY